MPLRGGDHHVTNYINLLEERFEERLGALEKAISKLKSGVTAAAVEKIVDAKLDEAEEADAKQAEAARPQPKEPSRSEPSRPEKSSRW